VGQPSDEARRILREGAEQVPAEVREDWERYVARTVLDMWGRPVLDVRARSLVTVAALATRGSATELRRQIRVARANGLDRLELCEVMFQVAGYGGLGTGFEGLVALREVFDEESDPGPPAEDLPPGIPGDDRFARSREAFGQIVPRYAEAIHARIGPYDETVPAAERPPFDPAGSEWTAWIHATSFGDLWTRPNLSLADRELVTSTVIIVLGRDYELRPHLEAALLLGLSRQAVAEAIGQIALYQGFPSAVSAMLLFQELLRELDAEA
jgi:4-carboxymuconolactone decarboxylase